LLGLIEPKQKQTQWKRQKEMSNRKKKIDRKKGEKRQKKRQKKRET
jgi:hypothetical protein